MRCDRWGLLASAVIVGGLLVAAGLVGPWARPAAAHATLVGTTPAADALLDDPPAEVVLRFDEPVEAADDAVEVFDRDGARVDDGGVESEDGGSTLVVPVEAEARGTYTVAWRVLSEDGHTISASFVFHVGERTGAVAVDEGDDAAVTFVAAVARWFALATVIVVVGAPVVAALARGEAGVQDRLRLVVAVSAGVGASAVAVSLVAQAAEGSGRSLGDALGVTWERAVGSHSGVLTAWRLVLLAVAGLTAAVPWTWRRSPVAPAGLGLAAVAVTSAAGHAWTADQRALAVVSDVVHLGAVGLWVGGLVALALVLRVAVEPGRLVRRFSTTALVCVPAVGITGIVSALFQVRYWDALANTGYGQLLLAKVAGFVVLVGFGWWNRFELLPRLDAALGLLRRSVLAEVGVAALVLAVTAALVGQAPARATFTQPYDATVEAETLSVQLQVDPARAGSNDLHLYFFEPGGSEPAAVDAVQVNAAVADRPPQRLPVTPVTSTHASALDAALTTPGTWSIEVTAVSEGVAATATFEVPIR